MINKDFRITRLDLHKLELEFCKKLLMAEIKSKRLQQGRCLQVIFFSTCEDEIIKSTFRPYGKSPSSNLSLNDCLCICMCVWMCAWVWISDHDPNVVTWLKYGQSLFDVEHDPISFLFIFVKRVVFWDQRINWVFKSWKYKL